MDNKAKLSACLPQLISQPLNHYRFLAIVIVQIFISNKGELLLELFFFLIPGSCCIWLHDALIWVKKLIPVPFLILLKIQPNMVTRQFIPVLVDNPEDYPLC